METYRKIYDKLPAELQIPEELRHRRVEVILLPLDNGSPSEIPEPSAAAWPDGFFARTEGAWAGETLVRPPQGDIEQRDELA